jgi:adenosylcobinamide-phosphate synthase
VWSHPVLGHLWCCIRLGRLAIYTTDDLAVGGCRKINRYAVLRHRYRVLLLALAADQLVGELPSALHPVAAMGQLLALGERLAPASGGARLLWGAGWLVGSAGLCATLAAALPRSPLVQGMAASTLLAYRALDAAAGEVQTALASGDLDEARRLLGWHLVSRPTGDLRPDEVAAAAIESLAENLSDSVIAPLLAYLLGGLSGLVVYRFCNTADAMWGYRDERYEYLGKAAACTDDVLNLTPARITAALLAVAAQIVNGRGAMAWRVAWRDHGRTASPNAGWPMAAMAGALDTTLTKRGHYTLGDGRREPDVAMMIKARAVARTAVALLGAALLAGSGSILLQPDGQCG